MDRRISEEIPGQAVPTRRFISRQRAAAYLGCDERTISRFIQEGVIPGYRIGDRMVRVDFNDIVSLVKPLKEE